MKKIACNSKLVALLALVLMLGAFGLTACSKGDKAEEPEEEVVEEEATEETEEATEEASEPSLPPTEVLGVNEETTYTNEFIGIKYTVPENWFIANDSQRAQVMGYTKDAISGVEDLAEIMESSGYVIDLYSADATQATNINSINITVEDIGKVYGSMLNESQIAQSNLDLIKETLETQGWSDVVTEITDVEFADATRTAVKMSAKLEDIEIYQTQVYIKKESYFYAITFATFGEDGSEALMKCFEAI